MYRVLRSSILDGAFPSGSRLPAHRELAARFGVAIMTVRQASGRLEQEGLIVSRQGRGTFVRSQVIPAVLIVDHDSAVRALLAGYIEWAGYRVVDASDADAAVRALSDDPAIVLVITGSRIPDQEAGVRRYAQSTAAGRVCSWRACPIICRTSRRCKGPRRVPS